MFQHLNIYLHRDVHEQRNLRHLSFYGQYDIMQSEFDRYMKQGFTVVLLAESETRKTRIQSMLSDMKIKIA